MLWKSDGISRYRVSIHLPLWRIDFYHFDVHTRFFNFVQLVGDFEPEEEFGTQADLRVDINIPLEDLADLLAYVEAQPDAFGVDSFLLLLKLTEQLKELWPISLWNAHAIVFDVDLQEFAFLFDDDFAAYFDGASRPRELESVAQEVKSYLLDPLRIYFNFDVMIPCVGQLLKFYTNVFTLGLYLLSAQDLSQGLVDIRNLHIFGERACFNLGHVEEVLHEVRDHLAGGLHVDLHEVYFFDTLVELFYISLYLA